MLPFDGILLACQYRIIEIELKSNATELVLIEYVGGGGERELSILYALNWKKTYSIRVLKRRKI